MLKKHLQFHEYYKKEYYSQQYKRSIQQKQRSNKQCLLLLQLLACLVLLQLVLALTDQLEIRQDTAC